MHPQTIFTKTPKGVDEIRNKTIRMPREVGLVFLAIDGKRTFADLLQNAAMDEPGLTNVLDKLVGDGYIKVFSQPVVASRAGPAPSVDDLDLDFTSPEAIARVNDEARAQARTEAEAKARAEAAARAAVEAKARQDAEAKAYEAAQARAKAEADAKARAEWAAAEAVRARARAEADIKAATEAQARAEAEARRRAAAEAKAKADAEAEARAVAEAKARVEVEAARQAAANARTVADARTRAEAEARSRAEAESRAREAVEAKLHAMEARLRQAEERATAEVEARAAAERRAREEAETTIRKAREEAQASIESERQARTEAQAQTEAERQLREEALKEAQQEMEARLEKERQLRAEAIRKAREEAEARARAEIETMIQTERKAREEAESRLQIERHAREEAERRGKLEIEARLEAERAAKAEAQAKAAEVAAATAAAARLMSEAVSKSDHDANQLKEQADRIAGTARRAHRDAIAKAQAEMMARVRAEQEAIKEKQTLVVAQERAEEEAIALANKERAARLRAEQAAMARVDVEMKAREQEVEEADAKARAEWQKRAEAMAAQKFAEKKAAREAAARARPPRPWGRIAALAAVVVIGLVVGLLHIMLFPVAGTEKLLSDRLQEPVRIGSLRFALYPSPHWKLGRIVIGNGEDIKIGAASAPLRSLESSGGTKYLDEVRLSAVTIDQDAMGRMAAWVKPQTGTQTLRIDSLKASNITLSVRDFKLPLFDATIALAADGALTHVVLREPHMSIELKPANKGEWTGRFKSRRWRPPFGHDVEFDELNGDVRILPGQVAVSGIEGTLYSGSIKGEATVKWGSQLDGDGQFSLTNVDLARLLPATAGGFSASGLLDSKMKFTSRGLRPVELLAAPSVVATFSVRKGQLNNVDLVRALQSSTRGGKTPFDEITGDVQVSGNRFMYRDISLTSPSLKASGAIDVLPNSDLSGRINAQVGSKTVVVTRATLSVGGNLRNPVLNP